MNNKFKIVIKGERTGFTTKLDGNGTLIAAALSQTLTSLCIENDIPKQLLLDNIKLAYELLMKEKNDNE